MNNRKVRIMNAMEKMDGMAAGTLAAMEKIGELNERLLQYGYTDREREEFLVRLLLCFFAEDTGLFAPASFFAYMNRTSERPIRRLNQLFAVLAGNPPENWDPEDGSFPVLDRMIFAEPITERETDAFFPVLLSGCRNVSWDNISPAIFGAMFQAVMNRTDRREWGAYYTSEENIRRVIDPLFYTALVQEREACRGNKRKLAAFQKRLASLRFLDPACGSGNFLILIYRLLRQLELSVIDELYDLRQRVLDVSVYCMVSAEQFAGIEIDPLQARIARISLWLTERQMNLAAAEQFGMAGYAGRLVKPLRIRLGNALNLDWREVAAPETLSYIVGNPPFAGARLMTPSQKADMREVFRGVSAAGNMDYVTAWYRKAAEYMAGTGIRAAFVSTNSICQGEQASILWRILHQTFGMEIDFAYRTFVWDGPASGQAKVHCVIVGFSDASVPLQQGRYREGKWIIDGKKRTLTPHINAYLAAAPEVYVTSHRKPLAEVPEMRFGSMANDNGSLIVNSAERRELLARTPQLKPWIRPFLGAEEFLNGKERYCLWFAGAGSGEMEEILAVPEIAERIRRVKLFREKSRRSATRKLSLSPELFGEIRQPESGSYILVPRVSSVRREYIPVGFLPAEWIASDASLIVPDGDEALFAMLESGIHMLWVRTIAGRLKSDYRYSASVVYNNFPFPELDQDERGELAACGREILAARAHCAGASLAELYDPARMPDELRECHQKLDRTAERIFGCEGKSGQEMLAVLFERYQDLSEGRMRR